MLNIHDFIPDKYFCYENTNLYFKILTIDRFINNTGYHDRSTKDTIIHFVLPGFHGDNLNKACYYRLLKWCTKDSCAYSFDTREILSYWFNAAFITNYVISNGQFHWTNVSGFTCTSLFTAQAIHCLTKAGWLWTALEIIRVFRFARPYLENDRDTFVF